jgi:hypothetical protein
MGQWLIPWVVITATLCAMGGSKVILGSVTMGIQGATGELLVSDSPAGGYDAQADQARLVNAPGG